MRKLIIAALAIIAATASAHADWTTRTYYERPIVIHRPHPHPRPLHCHRDTVRRELVCVK